MYNVHVPVHVNNSLLMHKVLFFFKASIEFLISENMLACTLNYRYMNWLKFVQSILIVHVNTMHAMRNGCLCVHVREHTFTCTCTVLYIYHTIHVCTQLLRQSLWLCVIVIFEHPIFLWYGPLSRKPESCYDLMTQLSLGQISNSQSCQPGSCTILLQSQRSQLI